MNRRFSFFHNYISDSNEKTPFSNTSRKLILEANGKNGVPIERDVRLREWCLGCMEAENNVVLIPMGNDKYVVYRRAFSIFVFRINSSLALAISASAFNSSISTICAHKVIQLLWAVI